MGLHGKIGGALFRQAREERLRRHNRLIHGLTVVPFGLALATLLVLAFGAVVAEPSFVAMIAMLIFALAGMIFMIMMLDKMVGWWRAVMPCFDRRGTECVLSDVCNVLVATMLVPALTAVAMAVVVDWRTVLVVLGPAGFIVTVVAFVMIALFRMISDSGQKVERAKRIYAETGSSGAVLLGMLRRQRED